MSSGISEESVLRRLLQQMNSQAPSRRVRLRELMSSDDPHYTGKDGRQYAISREELVKLSEALRKRNLYELKLPIVILADARHERPVWRVEGEDECAVVSEVLGRAVSEDRARLYLYGPHMAQLRKELPTTTVCVFVH